MAMPSNRAQRESTATAPESGAYVYCKGCGTQLESRTKLKPRAVVEAMMCAPCREKHGHALVPAPGEPTFCYRCGTPEETFVSSGFAPATYHICPQCLPERYARYKAGNFEPPEETPAEEAKSS